MIMVKQNYENMPAVVSINYFVPIICLFIN